MSIAEPKPPPRARLVNSAWSISLLIGAGSAAFWIAFHSWHRPLPNHGLAVDSKYLDFGEAWEGSRFSWKLPIYNTGSSEVEVLDFASSCDCVSIKPRKLTLRPHETRDIQLDLNLAASPALPQKVHPFQAVIIPHIKDSLALHTGWRIVGRVKTLLEMSLLEDSSPLKITRGTSGSQSFRLTSAIELDRLGASCDVSAATGLTTDVRGAGNSFEVAVFIPPHLPPGHLKLDLVLQPERDGTRLPSKRVAVQMEVEEIVHLLPNPLELGPQVIGTKARGRLWVSPRDAKPITIVRAISGHEGTTIPAFGPEEASWYVDVEQLIAEPGPGMGVGALLVRLPSGRVWNVGFQVHWYGLGDKP